MGQDQNLELEDQLCFQLYAASRLLTKVYQPVLDKLNITYPQFLVLQLLWQNGDMTIKEIGAKLYLQSNTLTPLLKRMEKKKLVERSRSKKDERVVHIKLGENGIELEEKASWISCEITKGMEEKYTHEEYTLLLNRLKHFVNLLAEELL